VGTILIYQLSNSLDESSAEPDRKATLMTAADPHRAAEPGARLRANILSVPNGIALAAAAMAPVIAVVLNAPAAAPSAGAAVPLAFLIAFVSCLFVGNTVVQFARRLPSAGSFYTFNSVGLGANAGFATGWMFWIGYALLAPGLMTAVGAFASDYVSSTFGASIPWPIFSAAALAIVVGLSIRSIVASVRIDLALLIAEVAIFTILCVIAIATAGVGNSTQLYSFAGSPTGVSGVGLGVVFGILSFVGFDAAATLGEETKNPRRNVPLAVGGALVSVGVFYVFATYALSAGYGIAAPQQLTAFLADSSPIVTLADNKAPWLTQLVELAAIFGIFSCLLAVHNATVRIMFSLGRDHVLPGRMGTVHPRWASPFVAIVAQTVFTAVVGFGVGAWLGPGATGAYGWTGSIATVAIVLVYILSNIALIRYFWRLSERNPILHVVLPVLGVLALAFPVYAVGKPGQDWPYSLVPYVVLAWIVAGAAVWAFLRSRHPERLAAVGRVLAEDATEDAQAGGAADARTPALQPLRHPGGPQA
jgi:amino acid transporter